MPNLLHRSYWHDQAVDCILYRTLDSLRTTNQTGIHPRDHLERLDRNICAHNCLERQYFEAMGNAGWVPCAGTLYCLETL